MNKTKRISIMALSAALVVTSISSVVAAASDNTIVVYPNMTYASYVNNDMISYRILENETYADTVYIDSADLENGDYTFQAGVYLEADVAELQDMLHFRVQWEGYDTNGKESVYIYTGNNIVSYGYQWNDEKTNMLLNEIDLSNAVRYVGFQCSDWLLNGDFDVFAAGPYKVYYVDEETGQEGYLDLTVNEDAGMTIGIYNPTLYENTNGRNGYFSIPHYDPETPYGERFVREVNRGEVHCLSKGRASWLNEVTGDNKMIQFDVTVDEDTPDGVYYVGFWNSDSNPNYMSGMDGEYRYLVPSNVYVGETADGELIYHNDQNHWLKIVVGATEEEKAAAEEETCDVNQDGAIGLTDATEVLAAYANRAVGTTSGIQILKSVAADYDVDSSGNIDLDDALAVLTEYSRKGAGLE